MDPPAATFFSFVPAYQAAGRQPLSEVVGPAPLCLSLMAVLLCRQIGGSAAGGKRDIITLTSTSCYMDEDKMGCLDQSLDHHMDLKEHQVLNNLDRPGLGSP